MMEFRDIRKIATELAHILDKAIFVEEKNRIINSIGEILFILETEWAVKFNEVEHSHELLSLEAIMLSQKELLDLFFKLEGAAGEAK